MRKFLALLSGLTVLLWAPAAPGTVLNYDIEVDGATAWIGTSTRPYGLPSQPGPLFATLAVDNTITGKSGVLDFFFVTGAKTWTEALINDSPFTTQLTFDASGELINFVMSFQDSGGSLVLATGNTMSLREGTNSINCNGCVSFSRAAAANAPAPGTLALLLGAGVAGALARRRDRVA